MSFDAAGSITFGLLIAQISVTSNALLGEYH
jgi:hypothetical protein